MSEGEQEIIRLLTEMRDAQREEQSYRRRMLDESVGLQRRAVRLQRVAMVFVLAAAALLAWWFLSNRPRADSKPMVPGGGTPVAPWEGKPAV